MTVLAGASRGPMRDRVPDGADVRILSPERPRTALSRINLGKHMAPTAASLAPDVIFVPGNFHFGVARAFKQRLPRVPIVAKISNPLVPAVMERPPMLSIARSALSGVTRGIDCFAATSPGLADDLVRLLPHASVTVLYNPFVPDGALPFRAREIRRAREALRLVGIGRLEAQKDWPLALRTIYALRREVEVTLTIYGEGPLRSALEGLTRSLGLENNVFFPGFTDDISQAFATAHALLVTSRYEGGPAVAAEALIHGVPVVSTACSHFLSDLIDRPALGRIVASRAPEDLARAALDLSRTAFAPEAVIEAKVAPLRQSRSALAYLEVFDSLVSEGARGAAE